LARHLVVLALALASIYRFRPSRTAPRWRWITWGSVLATILWIVASSLFSWYASKLGTFNKTYGSLAA
jgi:membrane protein